MLLSNLDRRVLATLKQRALGRLKPGLRIAVLGNCQSLDVAYAMKLLNIEATVEQYPIQTKAKITGKMLLSALRTYDQIFLQDFGPEFVRGASSDLLCSEVANVTRYPTLLFAAYHPDSIFIHAGSKRDAFLSGPIGQHHSALALFAYRAGLSPQAALRLYDPDVFDALVYFDLWIPSRAQLLETAKSYGLDLETEFMRWTRRGCFMYAVNHPKPHVSFDLARRLLGKAGILSEPVDFDNYVLDDLVRDTVFPVYPAIAEHYGIAGSYVFKAPEPFPGGMNIGGFWDLTGFVQKSFRLYARHKADDLANDRVQGWLDEPETCKFLKDFASRQHRPARSSSEQRTASTELT
jgi:Polysaccharide biosynthesis enzyme WcbI